MNRHLDFPNTVQAIRLVKKLFPEAQHILIEDKANGSAIIQTLRSEFVGVISITPKGGKVSRVNAVAPAIESGNVYVPINTTWAEEFIDEFSAFPAGKHDDRVDSASQALSYMLYTNGQLSGLPSDEAAALGQRLLQEQERFLGDGLYDVYGSYGDLY